MTNLTADQIALRGCVAELDALEREVNARMAPRETQTKQIPFELSESFVFQSGDMREKKFTFKNGAEDLYFYEPHFVPFLCSEKPGDPPSRVPMMPSSAGLHALVEVNPPVVAARVYFDFQWNYVVGSQGENYGSPAQELQWLSRQALGNRRRWLPLAFRYPLRLKGGDAITFSVKPLTYSIPLTTYQIAVNMTMTGRRNGRMAESQFDPEFRPAYRSEGVDPARLLREAGRPEFLPRGRK